MNNQKGFTLVEIMIACSITAVALLAFIGAAVSIDQTSEGLYQKSVAIQDAQQVMEQVRNAAQNGTFPANVTGTYSNGAAVGGFSNLPSETVTVSYVSATADPLDVTVTVSWFSYGRRTVSTAIRSLVTKRTI